MQKIKLSDIKANRKTIPIIMMIIPAVGFITVGIFSDWLFTLCLIGTICIFVGFAWLLWVILD